MKTNFVQMLKKISFVILAIVLLLAILGIVGIKLFNHKYFKEKSNYLTFTTETKPIDFEWSAGTYGDFVEPHEAILIPVKIEGFSNQFYFQFDTGAPSTLIYENPLKSLQAAGLNFNEVIKDDKGYIQNINLQLGGNSMTMHMPQIFKNYGKSFEIKDTLSWVKLGTIGADFMDQQITVINFKEKFIQLFKERPASMAALEFKPFDFKGRRFMLPAKIAGKKLDLFYDSGSSAFGLITSKHRYDNFTDKKIDAQQFNANSWGKTLTIHHKNTNKKMEIGNTMLGLKRVSYVDIYPKLQRLMAPFTRIGGWLGNKPFIESTLILDTKRQEFIIIEAFPTTIYSSHNLIK